MGTGTGDGTRGRGADETLGSIAVEVAGKWRVDGGASIYLVERIREDGDRTGDRATARYAKGHDPMLRPGQRLRLGEVAAGAYRVAPFEGVAEDIPGDAYVDVAWNWGLG